jgi:hypothetical protein
MLSWAIVLLVVMLCLGCSGNQSKKGMDPLSTPLTGSPGNIRMGEAATNHSLLGLFSCRVDTSKSDIEVVPLRDAMFHLNALRFLEPPPPVRMKLSKIVLNSQTVDVDVQLLHPFPGLDKYSGFDVCGIVIASGSYSGFSDPDLVVGVEGDTRLVNPDGLTRWWNPVEFPYNSNVPMWGYIDGKKGTPDSVAHYTATLNGYKYFADGLSLNDSVATIDHASRGAFIAGSANSRHYKIELDAGLVFNYAIDACWLPPVGEPVVVPDSFVPSSNREEPYFLTANVVNNTLFYDPTTGSGGGELDLDINCYDWFNGDKNTVRVESPGVFEPYTTNVITGGNDVFSTYHVDIINPMVASSDQVTIWVSAEAAMGYDGFLPNKVTSAFMAPLEVTVQVISTEEIKLVWGDETVIDHPNRVPYNDIDPALIINGDGNVLLSFFYWTSDSPQNFVNYPLFSTSMDNAHTFGIATYGQWQWHQVGPDKILCSNGKFTLGSNGQAFHSYECPAGHALHPMPTFAPYQEAASHSGTPIQHAGEMMYTVDGYPMMFGDNGGQINMQRGDYPNQGGTGTWPVYFGTPYTLTTSGNNWVSIARSSGKTSDGLCHVIFWNDGGLDYIQMVSTTDTSGQSWDQPMVVFNGLAEIWDGANDPSLWIDKNDGFHTAFCATEWTGTHHLMYGYSADGKDWNAGSFTSVGTFASDKQPHDTHVVAFDAFDETYIFLGYESDGIVWCQYKKTSETEFSAPIQVNVHTNTTLPDIYPNGDAGVVFAYQADDGSGQDLTDIFYRLAEFKKK